jgi:O-antigen ligase
LHLLQGQGTTKRDCVSIGVRRFEPIVHLRPVRHLVAGGVALLLVAALLALLPLEQALLLVAGSTAVVLLLRWPWLIWLPFAAALPVTSGLRFGLVSVTDLLLAAAVGLWFIDGARRRTLPLTGSAVIVAVGIYVAALVLSSIGAIDLTEAGAEVIKWAELWVLLLVAPVMLTVTRSRWVAAALVLGAVAQSIFGLYQFIFRVGPDFFVIMDRFMRAYGTFGQPNPFGGYLGLTLPVALSLAIWGWHELLQPQRRHWPALLWAAYFSGATLVIGAGLLASWSRGAWLGAAAGILIVVALRSRTAALLSGLTALGVAVAILLGALSPELVPEPVARRVQDVPAYFGLTDVLNEPLTDDNFSVVERVAHWTAAQRMWERAPWVGVGPGNYAVVYPEVRLPRWEDALGHAHNVYLNVLGESGLAGFAAYMALMVTLFGWTWRRMVHAAHRKGAAAAWMAALAIGVLGNLGHLAVHNIVDNLYVQGMVLHLGLWLALVHVQYDGELL